MKRLLVTVVTLGLLLVSALPALADDGSSTATQPMKLGADRLVAIQNSDGGFPWTIPGATASNTIGVTASGLLGAYQRTENHAYLAAAKKAGDLLVKTYNAAPANRPYSQDVEFLVRLSLETGNHTYGNVAKAWFANTIQQFPTGDEFVSHYINGRGSYRSLAAWDVAAGIRAAKAAGQIKYARDIAAAIVAHEADWKDTNVAHKMGNGFPDNPYSFDFTILGEGSLTWAFKDLGVNFEAKIKEYRAFLLSVQEADGSWDMGDLQMTSYVMLGLAAVEGNDARIAIGKGAGFLVANQLANGGFPGATSDPTEYGEVDGEVVLALSNVNGEFHASEGSGNHDQGSGKKGSDQHAQPRDD